MVYFKHTWYILGYGPYGPMPYGYPASLAPYMMANQDASMIANRGQPIPTTPTLDELISVTRKTKQGSTKKGRKQVTETTSSNELPDITSCKRKGTYPTLVSSKKPKIKINITPASTHVDPDLKVTALLNSIPKKDPKPLLGSKKSPAITPAMRLLEKKRQ